MADRRISAGAGLVFKGSGFYITDYGKDGKKDQRTNAAAAASSLAEKPAGKGDGGSKVDGGSSPDSGKKESSKSESTKTESTKSDSAKPVAKADSAPAPKSSGSSDK
jgi:hypothetical protein